MKPATRLIARQSGWLVLLLVLFALANGAYVCEGLWQGGGLYGYILERSAKGGPPRMVSVWAAFVQMLACVGLAGVLVIFGLRYVETPQVTAQGPSRVRRRKPPLSAGRRR